jgi:hypothetical protein
MDIDYRAEYKVGNLVCYMMEGKTELFMIRHIYEGPDFVRMSKTTNLAYEYEAAFMALIPIPLTEKRLERFNFFLYSGKHINDGCSIISSGKRFVAEINGKAKELKHVHQLQNFFRDNKGYELPVPEFRK